ncbi:hypothetical protein JL720_2201 [Aureococcus anophagefferens]|nr:hypothetical protein JL720_2201 [Aureococcus anophagefferens]
MMVKKPASLLAVATRSGRGRYYGLPGETMALPGAPPGREPEPGLDGRIVRIAVPSLFALALDPILNVVDTAFVGLGGGGAAPLAAVSASTSFFGFVFACTNCFASAGTPLVAAELKPGGGGEAGALALGSSIVRSALLVGVVLAGRRGRVGPAMDLFAPAYELHGAAVDFSRLRALSAPAVVAAAALNGSLRGLGDASSALKAASLAAVVNVLLDIALIYGLGMNPNGAAIATACAEYAAAAYLGAVFLSRRRGRRRRGRRGGADRARARQPRLHLRRRAVSAAALVAAATLFAPVDGRDALSAAWDAIAVLNGCRFFAFAYRFYARGPLVARAEDGDAEGKV